MYNHAPKDYKCPLCLASIGIENEDTMVKQADIFYKDDFVFAMINSKFFPNNPGHVIVVPVEHYENIYDLPEKVGHRIFDIARKVAIAMKKTRNCDGVTTQQNNEPASEQHAFHFHFHIIPRFENDRFWENRGETRVSKPEERTQYSEPLRNILK